MKFSVHFFLVSCFSASMLPAAADEALDFNRDIRPILSENCFYCHGQDQNKRQAELRLDERESAIESGAIVPGDADSSVLVQRILSTDPDEQMPPSNSNRRLTDEQKATLTRWISDGRLTVSTGRLWRRSNRIRLPCRMQHG